MNINKIKSRIEYPLRLSSRFTTALPINIYPNQGKIGNHPSTNAREKKLTKNSLFTVKLSKIEYSIISNL
jgi:hypothetical protein